MLPWASFPKRFPIDERFAPKNDALGCAEDSCLRVPAHEARARSSRRPVVLPRPSRCVGPSVAPCLDDRVTLRCDVPRRVASRCADRSRAETRPVSETAPLCLLDAPGAKNASGAAFPGTTTIRPCGRVPSLDPPRRSATGLGHPPGARSRGSRVAVGDTAPKIRVLASKPAKARSSRCGTLLVPRSPTASLPSGRGRLRAVAPGFT
jgi:hypothetical protein